MSFQVISSHFLIFLQIQMPTEIERRVGNLLNSSQKAAAGNESNATSSQGGKHASLGGKIVKPASMLETDAAKEKQSIELKQKQDKLKVNALGFLCEDVLTYHILN